MEINWLIYNPTEHFLSKANEVYWFAEKENFWGQDKNIKRGKRAIPIKFVTNSNKLFNKQKLEHSKCLYELRLEADTGTPCHIQDWTPCDNT